MLARRTRSQRDLVRQGSVGGIQSAEGDAHRAGMVEVGSVRDAVESEEDEDEQESRTAAPAAFEALVGAFPLMGAFSLVGAFFLMSA